MALPLLTEYRDLLLPIAYNMLGSTSDAEDLVQETMLKWLSLDRETIQNERGYLVRILVNRCLNFIRDRRREQPDDVEAQAEANLLTDHLPAYIDMGPSLSLGVQAMLAKLSPMERAVFLLKEVFHFSHKELADILDISEAYCRQILRRARAHLQAENQRFEVDPDRHLQLYRTFVEVCQGQDLHQLLELLKEDIDLDISRPAASAQRLRGRAAVAWWLQQQHQVALRYELQWLGKFPAVVVYLYAQPLRRIRVIAEGGQIARLVVEALTAHPLPASV
jgi:RNA polymerase sigma-70 factor (ECF subfamily)